MAKTILRKTAIGIAAALIMAGVLLFLPASASAAARSEVLMKGDKDGYVLEIQKALYEKGFLKHKPTGYFGTDTEDALIAFQKKQGLKADGKAGPRTRKEILGSKYKPIKDREVSDKKDDAAVDKIYPGDKGDDVGALQKSLKELGYYKYGKITDYYGPSTKTAVERFQRTNELDMDGVAGPKTLELIKSGKAKYYTIYYKDKGADIEDMQGRLKVLGYYKSKPNGYFGGSTLTALKGFQKTNGLKADGKAGRDTLLKLYSKKAKKAGKNYAPPKPKPAPKPKPVIGGKTKIEKLINYAKAYLGRRYRRGGNGPSSFDCSGYVSYCLKYVGVKLPRTSASQSRMEQYQKIDNIADLKPGDLMFFKTHSSATIGHVGVFIGGGKFIHCAPRVGVQIRDLTKGSYYYGRFRWGRRVFTQEA
jgi:peptidoglycan hydrolase-like protein with peptidoglycan-binding domain